MSAIPSLPENVLAVASAEGNTTSPSSSSFDDKPNTNGTNPSPSQTTSVNGNHTNGFSTSTSPPWLLHDQPVENSRPIKVIVIGCGFSGVLLGIRIPERLRNCELVIYEKNAGIGGTWWENRYPGAACDVPSHSYQFSFNPKPDWSSLYAPSNEIRDYLQSTATKYGVDRFVKLEHTVTGAHWNQDEGKWHVSVQKPDGATFEDIADVVVSARGNLNRMMWPDIPGLDTFQGELMHSAKWNQDYDFTNKRIGIIGSGSSAIQIIPKLQKLPGATLDCYIRGRTWISPPFAQRIQDKYGFEVSEFPPSTIESFRNDPNLWAQFRLDIEADGNNVHAITLRDTPIQRAAVADFQNSMRQRLAKKPHYYDALEPTFSPGCRRLTPGPGFLEALVQDNVSFIKTPIEKIESHAVITQDGTRREIDVLACATGFYASTAPIFPVTGIHGETLQDHWSDRATNYLSLATDGFPNYFLMLGPNAAIGEGSLSMMIESTGDYIIKAIRKIQKENLRSMSVKPERVADFLQYCDTYFAGTVFSEECSSWYKKDGQGNSGSKVTGLWPGSTLHCIEALRSPRWEDYLYVYHDEPTKGAPINQLAWLGNGWATRQVDSKNPPPEALAFYILPEFQERDIGVPSFPKPEENGHYAIRPWSY